MSKVTLSRLRNTDYQVRCEINGDKKVYTWKGSTDKKIDKKQVPQAVVDWLNMNTTCFSKGKLVIEGEGKLATQARDEISDIEGYENNVHTREEIKEALLGHHMTLEKFLSNITVDDEKRFVLDVASELQEDMKGANITRIAEWAGIEKEVLFD